MIRYVCLVAYGFWYAAGFRTLPADDMWSEPIEPQFFVAAFDLDVLDMTGCLDAGRP